MEQRRRIDLSAPSGKSEEVRGITLKEIENLPDEVVGRAFKGMVRNEFKKYVFSNPENGHSIAFIMSPKQVRKGLLSGIVEWVSRIIFKKDVQNKL